ncbi:SLBB domain-containing protein [Luteolibacter pohnpeiensis]|uniref:SLBB domain-containing protein n=1 Tax=Luteolibacter pohnpeiensis TaxID=454153 RepID=A0A934S4M1_9BACT|nr:SLBB domain-containing protein [Luteolibacter pohnpeiensis]MBK1883045.1 SLBB domain-containing protein [Luteolibacter pohnpeiensis]
MAENISLFTSIQAKTAGSAIFNHLSNDHLMKSFTLLSLLIISWLLPNTSKAQDDDSSYIIRPNDTINLLVYEEPDLSVQVTVLKTGEAAFPLIESVKIGGLSMEAATKKIKDLYAKDFLVEPRITLTVDKYATDYISVLGAVKQPGQIPIPLSGNLDLGSAVATAQGLLATADQDNIQLIRASGSTSTYSLSQIQGSAGRTKLYSGDRVIVNESRFVNQYVRVLGQVKKPGAVEFPVDGKLDLVSAIAMAGGLTDLAKDSKIRISRGNRIQEVDFRDYTEKEGTKPYYLQPDDIITVPQRIF